MKYRDFANIISPVRMNRYLEACNGDSRKAMTLYRKNLQLSQEIFTIISCFEISLRNAIDYKCSQILGENWLKESIELNGIFNNNKCRLTKQNIEDSLVKIRQYNHNKLVAELGFGFWRYMFAQNQYNATSRILLKIFPSKPTSSATLQYDNTYIFNQLAKLNEIRNRIAHHEPICFYVGESIKNTAYARLNYNLMLHLFQWMQIDESALLYGLDHINIICNEIDNL